MPSEIVTAEGHLIDGGVLARILDHIIGAGGTFEIVDLKIGLQAEDPSFARMRVEAAGEEELALLLAGLQQHGANAESLEDAVVRPAEVPGAFPTGFYSTTNLGTEVRIGGRWIEVEHPEMDCGVVISGASARTVPMSEVEEGMQIVMAGPGIRVHQLEPAGGAKQAFGFMSSDVSSEKPKSLLVERVADRIRAAKEGGKRILWVVGPAVVHTGAAPDLAALIRAGYVDAFFAGNGVAAHDIESHMFGTSLGIRLSEGVPVEHGHEHHIRAINEIRKHGSLEAAIEAGVFDDGIVYHLVQSGVPCLFGGSARDDGPLPEVVTDMMEVQTRLRGLIWGDDGDDLIGFCIVVGSMLHGIATGNCLPASVPLVCVDINQGAVTKLMDRGSFQSMGIITDVGLFVRVLAELLAPEEVRRPSEDAAARSAGSRTRT